ncbi:MAG: hypothetical protein ISS48_00770 [Candidatus Aenigmarchaeota archaeon]|nr:hypothetical protein [Candidatus Aenigmarchaeota archaeon]
MIREKFLKAFANLPEDERSQIIVIIENRPYSWGRAYDEIKAETELGSKILEKMHKLGLI